MKICPCCERENPQGSLFCGWCGTALEEPQAAGPVAPVEDPAEVAGEPGVSAPKEEGNMPAWPETSVPMGDFSQAFPAEDRPDSPAADPFAAVPQQTEYPYSSQPYAPPYPTTQSGAYPADDYRQVPPGDYPSAGNQGYPSQKAYSSQTPYPPEGHSPYYTGDPSFDPAFLGRKPQGGLAIAAFVLSLLAFIFSALGVANIFLYLGIGFTIAAWASMRPYKGKGLAIAAIVLSAVALLTSFAVTASWLDEDSYSDYDDEPYYNDYYDDYYNDYYDDYYSDDYYDDLYDEWYADTFPDGGYNL